MMKTMLLASACALAMPSIAAAQTIAPPAAAISNGRGTDNNEIIITATRRSELLSNVPIAVSAVTAEALQNSGANDIRSLNQLAPSLLVSSTGTEANGSARIRGIGTVGDNPGLESSVAVFIDGVYRSRTGAGLNELGDIERIEVLRGPQGTLFGRNASSGLINIVSKKPSFELGGGAEASYGNYDYYRLGGSVTGPVIADKLAARIDGVYVNRKGFYKDVVSGARINDRDRFFVRGQLLFTPTEDVSLRLIGDYSHRKESCCAATYLPVKESIDPTANTATPGFNSDRAFVYNPTNRIIDVLTSLGGIINQNTFLREVSVSPGRTYAGTTRDYGLSGELNWDLGGAKLTTITAYRDYKSGGGGDVDYNNVDIIYRANDGLAYRQFKTFSQEARLQGTLFGDKLDWLIGGYYSNEKLTLSENLQFGSQYGAFAACRLITLVSASAALRNPAAPGCLTPTGIATLNGAFGAAGPLLVSGLNRLTTVNNVGDNGTQYRQDSSNYAFFTHNVLHITDSLSLTAGIRWTHEKKKFAANFNNNNTICGVQQAAFLAVLPGGAAAFPASLQGITQAIVNLTCQGNTTSALNALNLSDQRSESEFTGTAVLSYKVSHDLLTYASYSKGYKAGGFNLDRSALGLPIYAPTDPRNITNAGFAFGTKNLQFDPEKVDSYEAGLKYSSRHFNLNVAAFREEFKNFQLNTFNGSVFLVQTVNGCKDDLGVLDKDQSAVTGACAANRVKAGVVSQGFEVESAVFPAPDVMAGIGFTYAETKYAKHLIGNQTGAALDPALFLLPGSQLSNAPKYVVTGSMAWTPSVGSNGMSALFYGDFRYSGGYNTGSDLFPEKVQPGFITVNARVGLRGKDDRFSVELWSQNLLNQNYQQVAFNAPFQGGSSVAQTVAFGTTANQLFGTFLAEPRTFGVTVRTKF